MIESLSHGRPVYIVGAEGDVRKRLDKLGVIARLPADNVTGARNVALERAAAWLEGKEGPQAASVA